MSNCAAEGPATLEDKITSSRHRLNMGIPVLLGASAPVGIAWFDDNSRRQEWVDSTARDEWLRRTFPAKL